jgi:hypothetical protein
VSGEHISLMSGFADLGKNGKAKGVIRVKSDDLIFDPNDRAVAQAAADAIMETVRENMIRGLAPDGQALPTLKSSTVDRRDYEQKQGQRGGEAHERFKDPAFRALVSKNYKRDYDSKHEPTSPQARGDLSGLLLDSFKARGDRSGKGVTIYVAAKRGRPRPARSETGRAAETQSALESVLAGAPVVSPRLIAAPKIRRALGEIVKGLIGKPSDLKRAFKQLFKEMTATGEELSSVAEELEQ